MALADLGVCYFPEHWPQECWAEQADCMAAVGLRLVRMGEFAWSRIEPRRDHFDWEWLDTAIETLAARSLQVILCTPTACPPKWLVDEYPEILPVSADGQVRGFGSRRHYRFASSRYRTEALRISSALLERYAEHPAVVGWQLDNEYGCHDTTLSFAEDDRREFQRWLGERYASIEALNSAWGTQFWSQTYGDFGAVELPVATVTEANPAHRMDYWRFANDALCAFNREQSELLRQRIPASHWITHNFMGNFVDFDHFEAAKAIDVASWDSYPLGFLDQGWFSNDEKQLYRRIGHPDWAAFHHDLYRGVGNGRMAVMEQQPGPVNWAQSNAQPLDGAVAFWTMEAVAHGAEFVSYFRFRQYPRAQEQMHAALQLPDGSPAPAQAEVRRVADELAALPDAQSTGAPVALLFDYPSCWATAIQPHTPDMDTLQVAFEYYRALRSLGLDIDIVSTDCDLSGYRLIVIPVAIFVDATLAQRVRSSGAACVIGPRCGSRDDHFAIPGTLAPGALQSLIPLRVIAVDSLRRGSSRRLRLGDEDMAVTRWYETVETELTPRILGEDDSSFWYQHDQCHYLNGWVSHGVLQRIFADVLATTGIHGTALPEGFRLRTRGRLRFVFNWGATAQHYAPANARRLLGEDRVAQGRYAVWQLEP